MPYLNLAVAEINTTTKYIMVSLGLKHNILAHVILTPPPHLHVDE